MLEEEEGSGLRFFLGVDGVEEGAEEVFFLSKQGGRTKGEAGGRPTMVRAKDTFSSGERALGSKRTFITSW